LSALSQLRDTTLIFTYPNVDEGGGVILDKIVEFTRINSNSFAFQSLGSQVYFSILQIVDGVVGNSSSGLAEVPSAKKATVNIGERQSGRIKAQSVIDCDPTRESVLKGIEKIYSKEYQNTLAVTVNPYGDGGASQRVFEVLKELDFRELIKKTFYDF
jgi:GDP/UDP-N,N'-diacetylbacillosamine 2-epimerase (hydrolysing)